MSNNIPQWAQRAAVIALVTVLISGAVGWATATSTRDTVQERDIAVLTERTQAFEKSLNEVKASQHRIEDKLDKVLERR